MRWNSTSPYANVSDMDTITNQLGIDPHKDLRLKTPDAKQKLKQRSQGETKILVEQPKGQLLYDTNTSDAGLGDGGIVSRFKGQADLEADILQ